MPHAHPGHAATSAAAYALVINRFHFFSGLFTNFRIHNSPLKYQLTLALYGLPAFFPQALPRRGTPFDTGRRLLLVDIFAAFPALYPELIGEHLHLSAAIPAFIQRRF
jgi:hypothetical protein